MDVCHDNVTKSSSDPEKTTTIIKYKIVTNFKN